MERHRFKIVFVVTLPVFLLLIKPETVLACYKIKDSAQQIKCFKDKASTVDNHLNQAYAKLKKLLSKGDFNDLRESQKAWVNYRNRDCGIDPSSVKSKNWVDEVLMGHKQIFCVKNRTSGRLRVLTNLLNSYNPHKYESSICKSFLASVKYSFDIPWVKARSIPTTHTKATIKIQNGEKHFLLHDNGISVELDLGNNIAKIQVGYKYHVRYFPINSDYRGGLILQSSYTPYDIGDSYVFIRNGNRYRLHSAPGSWYFSEIILFNKSPYFVTYAGEVSRRTVDGVTVSSINGGNTNTVCQFKLSHKERVLGSSVNCSGEKVCGFLSNIPELLTLGNRYWQNTKSSQSREIDKKMFSMPEGEFDGIKGQSLYWVDINNDKKDELIVIVNNLSSRWPYEVRIFQLKNGKYKELKTKRGNSPYGLPKRLSPNGEALFILQDKGINYVVRRNVNDAITEYSAFNDSFKFKLFLTRENKIILVEKKTVYLPATLRLIKTKKY